MLGLTAEQIGTVILGISLGIIGLMGGQKGKQIAQGKPQQSEVMEVAGAIVSDKAVDRMVTALDGFTAAAKLLTLAIDKDVEAKAALTKALTENSRALSRNSDVCEDVHDQLKDAGAKMDRMRDELIRSQVGR